jgi:hypothetical protein
MTTFSLNRIHPEKGSPIEKEAGLRNEVAGG